MKVRTLAITVAAFLSAVAILLIVDHVYRTLYLDPVPVVILREPVLCRRSVDRVFVADEKGRVCKWQDVNYETGCCPDDQSTEACLECKENCCSIYAYCISCCLQPSNPMQQPNFSTPEPNPDKFEYCRVVCRTSSRSVINENQWISELKYCFPTEDFPFLLPKEIPSLVINHESEDGETLENMILEKGHTEFMISTQDGLNLGMGKVGEKVEKSMELVKFQEEPESEIREGEGEGEFEGTLDEIAKMQKSQENLLEQLGEQMKKLVAENNHLTEENKSLLDKLEEVTKKGRLEELKTKQPQPQKQLQKQTNEEQNGSGKYHGLVGVLLFMTCLWVYNI